MLSTVPKAFHVSSRAQASFLHFKAANDNPVNDNDDLRPPGDKLSATLILRLYGDTKGNICFWDNQKNNPTVSATIDATTSSQADIIQAVENACEPFVWTANTRLVGSEMTAEVGLEWRRGAQFISRKVISIITPIKRSAIYDSLVGAILTGRSWPEFSASPVPCSL